VFSLVLTSENDDLKSVLSGLSGLFCGSLSTFAVSEPEKRSHIKASVVYFQYQHNFFIIDNKCFEALNTFQK